MSLEKHWSILLQFRIALGTAGRRFESYRPTTFSQLCFEKAKIKNAMFLGYYRKHDAFHDLSLRHWLRGALCEQKGKMFMSGVDQLFEGNGVAPLSVRHIKLSFNRCTSIRASLSPDP